MKSHLLTIALLISASVTDAIAVTVGGIINTDTTWGVTSSVYTISSPVQVAPGVTLTINPGVTVSSGDIEVFGTLNVAGTTNSFVRFIGTNIKPGENSATQDQPFIINIQYSEFTGGSIYYATGNATYGSLYLRDSKLIGIPYIHLWYPVADSYIERNTFINSGGIDAGLQDVDLFVRNNAFIDLTTDYAVKNWAAYGSANQIVEFNSFLSQDRVALALQYSNSAMNGSNNYWGTVDKSIIESMVLDQNDDLALPGYIDYLPILTEPHPSTPSVTLPTTSINLSGTIKTTDGMDICAMVLTSGQFIFSCNPNGVFSLTDLPREQDGTIKRQIYADGFFPKVTSLMSSIDIPVVLTRSGNCPNYNVPYDPGFVPGSAGKHINIAGKVLTQKSQTPICAMVLANGKHTFSCDATGSYSLNIPLDTNGQYKLQVYADGFAPTIQTFDEFSPANDVHMARAVECQ